MSTFVVAVISQDKSIRDAVVGAMENNPRVEAVWTLNDYPASGQLTQLRDAEDGCVVFIDFTDAPRARAVVAEIERSYPMAAPVAICVEKNTQELLDLMQLGIREVISIPTPGFEIARTCDRAARRVRRAIDKEKSDCSLYAFLPARPGSGATTIALHSAAAAARLSGASTLLIDFDLRLGMTSFLLKLHGERSVLDALELSAKLNPHLWDGLLCRNAGLDILGSAPFELGREGCERGAARVLDYALQHYSTVCVDLPGELREHELETIQRAREIFLVCTSDLGTLYMARRKVEYLQSLDLNARLTVIMNRADDRGAVSIKHVEEILQLPVAFTLPSADREIAEATQRAKPIEGRSTIASQLEKIARRMVAAAPLPNAGPKLTRRFIEFFSVTPIRGGYKR